MSYSRADGDWLIRFETMLRPQVRNRGLELWSDTAIAAGRMWRPEIDAAIARADAALLLVSPEFLASEFIMHQELPSLIRRGVPIAPVLLRSCRYGDVAELHNVQWAHDPVRDGPVAAARDVDGAIVRVTDALMMLLDDGSHVADAIDEPVAARRAERVVLAAPPLAMSARLGEVDDAVPPPPLGFVEREELDELRAALLAAGGGAVAITGGGLGLHGQGGIGKTVLAATLARDERLRRHFPDGVRWVTVGERADLVALQIDLLARVGAPGAEARTTIEGLDLLRDALAGQHCLLVVDDVWTAAAAEAFQAIGPTGRVLYTTRDPATLRGVRVDMHRIEVLSAGAARGLLAELTGAPIDAAAGDVERILLATGRVALALALVGAAVGRGSRTWHEVADELDRAGETFLKHPYANVFKAMQVAIATLDADLAAAHESLAVYPEDRRVPVEAVARWWEHLHRVPPAQTRAKLEQLAQRELLSLDGDSITLHDLQRDFLLLHVQSLGLLHHEVLEAYRVLLPARDSPWRELPQGEPYIWENLLAHMSAAGDRNGVRQVATDLGYIALRSFRSGPNAVEADLRRAAIADPDDGGIRWVLRLMSQRGHLMAGHERVVDLAATLAIWTARAPPEVDRSALSDLLPAKALVPCWGVPDAPDALLRVLECHNGLVKAIAFAADGRTLASISSGGIMRLWDPATGDQVGLIDGYREQIASVAFAPDGRSLATGGHDGGVRLWDPATGAQALAWSGHAGGVFAVAFAPDGRTLTSAGRDGAVRLWDSATGEQIAALRGHAQGVYAVAFAPDGRTIASADWGGAVRLWDTATGTLTAMLAGHVEAVQAVAFAPDGRTLATAGEDHTVRLWDTTVGAQRVVLEGHTGWVEAVAFSPDGRTLASAGWDGTVRLSDPDGSHLTVLDQRGVVRAVAFSPDGSIFASTGDDEVVRLWDSACMRCTVPEARPGSVVAIALSPDGATLATAGDDGAVRLRDTITGAQTGVLEGHDGGVTAVAIGPDGLILASAGSDGTVRLWDLGAGTERAVLVGHRGAVSGVSFAVDGSALASAGVDQTVRFWDPANGTQRGSQPLDAGRIREWGSPVAFSPDSRTLGSPGWDGAVRLWDAATGTQLAVLKGHVRMASAIAFSADGRTLAIGGDGTVLLWDLATGAVRRTLTDGRSTAYSVAFAPDGHTLASGDHDGTVRLWNLAADSQPLRVRFGDPIVALAFDTHGLVVVFGRSVVYLQIADADRHMRRLTS